MSNMEETKKISSAVIRRLPRYYRYLGELIESGVQRISSKELSARMKVTASQIRQDLNNFGARGGSLRCRRGRRPVAPHSTQIISNQAGLRLWAPTVPQ